MKAILIEEFGGPEVLVFSEAEMPNIQDTQILIRNFATSVNAPDIIQRLGNYPPPPGDSVILGLEVAGVVEKVGKNVTRWKVGDAVMALVGGGGYAEFTAANENHAMPIPDGLSYAQAACICETYLTAYLNIFLLGKLENTEKALLHGGGGGVNTAAIQLCNALTPQVTTFVTASSGKLEKVQALGVDHVIDYSNQSFVSEIAEATEKKGVNVILDHIGGPYFIDNMKSLSVGGRLLQIGVSKGIKAEINLAVMMVKRQQIIGSVLRSRSRQEKAVIIEKFSEQVLPIIRQGKISPLVFDVLPLADASIAHQMMQNSQHFGKIVLQINDEESNV